MRLLSSLVLLVSIGYAFTGVFKPGLQVNHSDSTDWNSYLSLRLMHSPKFGSVRTDFAWVISPTIGNPALQGPENNQSQFRLADLDARIYPENWDGDNSFSILQNIDRLSFQIKPARIRTTIGRQAIYWGVSKTVSPTDFIAPLPYGAINTDYRAGVDAVRAVYPLGMMSEIESGFVFGDKAELDRSGYWLRSRFYLASTDVSVLVAEFRENTLFGGSVNRALGGSVGWLETASTKPEDGDSYWRLSTGLERSFWNSTLYGFTEYHYNSAAVENHEDYSMNLIKPAYTSGGVYLMAKHYLASGVSITASPLLTLNANALLNLNDLSLQYNLTGDYSLSDNSAVEVGASGGFGSSGTEFKDLPSAFFLIYSTYF